MQRPRSTPIFCARARAALLLFAVSASLCALFSALESAYWNEKLSDEALRRASARYLTNGELAEYEHWGASTPLSFGAFEDRLLASALDYGRSRNFSPEALKTIEKGVVRWGVDENKVERVFGEKIDLENARSEERRDYASERARDRQAARTAKESLKLLEDAQGDLDLTAAMQFLNEFDLNEDPAFDEREACVNDDRFRFHFENECENEFGNEYGNENRFQNGTLKDEIFLMASRPEIGNPLDSALIVSGSDFAASGAAIYGRRACEASQRLFLLVSLGTFFYLPRTANWGAFPLRVLFGAERVVRAVARFLERLSALAFTPRTITPYRSFTVSELPRESASLRELDVVRLLI